MSPAVAGQYGRMDHPRHAADLYEAPPEAVAMLLRHMLYNAWIASADAMVGYPPITTGFKFMIVACHA